MRMYAVQPSSCPKLASSRFCSCSTANKIKITNNTLAGHPLLQHQIRICCCALPGMASSFLACPRMASVVHVSTGPIVRSSSLRLRECGGAGVWGMSQCGEVEHDALRSNVQHRLTACKINSKNERKLSQFEALRANALLE